MNSSKVLKSLLLLAVFSSVSIAARAQSFDYHSHPRLNFTFKNAQISLQIDPQNVSLNGSVLYNLTANISGADTLLLDAPEIKIDSVQSQGRKLFYDQRDNHLRIALTDSSQRGKDYSVKIYYQAAPHFGLLKSSEGTIWTSMLPRSIRHWLPVRDNPRVRMNVTFSLHIPDDYKVFASGIIRDKHMFHDSTKKITFKTGDSIPITSLAFGVGHFHGINSFAEPNSISSKQQQKLVSETKKIIQSIKDATGKGYPFQRVTLAILNDDHWETKSYGASTVFLYKNRGNWLKQLRRGLVAQWIGVYLNEGQWSKSWPIHFMQAVLSNEISGSEVYMEPSKYDPQTPFPTVYDKFGLKDWNYWQDYKSWNIPIAENIIDEVISKLLKSGSTTVTPETFKIAWYKASGQPKVTLPTFHPTISSSGSEAGNDTIRYRVDFHLNEQKDTLNLAFKAEQGELQRALTLPVIIIADSSNQTKQIDLSGSAGSFSMLLPGGTQNVRLKIPARQHLVFEVHKPVEYSLYQLNNADDVKLQTRAARQLGYHTDDPDLQLALVNAMKKDNKPEVQTALLKSYGEITKGASGTQKRFLDALSSDHEKIQLAALKGLQNYKSESVTQRLKKVAETNTDPNLAGQAMAMFMGRVDSTAALNFTNTLVQQDTSGTRAIVAAGALAKNGYSKRAMKYAGFYAQPLYAYPVRKQALQILLSGEDSTGVENEQLSKLINDYDPRIRYLMARNIRKISLNADSVLSEHQEYDARVYKALKKGQEVRNEKQEVKSKK